MPKEMLINVAQGEECRIALLNDGRVDELYMERTSAASHVGNIYKGRVTNVEASIQAAFVDFGVGRNGFLHVSDLLPTYFGGKGNDDVEEYVGKKMARRDRPPIQRCLRRGDEIIVQVIKEGIGTKGPTLSSYLSISGKMLVMMPGVAGRGVSKKIEDEDERRRLKRILVDLRPPEDCGFIIRTEAVDKDIDDLDRDLTYLARLWDQIKERRDAGPSAGRALHRGRPGHPYRPRRVQRPTSSGSWSTTRMLPGRVRDVVRISDPDGRNKVEVYDDVVPLFSRYGIEAEIEQMYSRHVPLPGGGSPGDRQHRGRRHDRRQQRQVPRPQRRRDDGVQDRHGGRRSRSPASSSSATWAGSSSATSSTCGTSGTGVSWRKRCSRTSSPTGPRPRSCG